MCAVGQEGAGALVLCISAMSLMIIKVDDLIAPDARDEVAELSSELSQRNADANLVYRRAATLGSLLEVPHLEWHRLAPDLAYILCNIDSHEATVDVSIADLRLRLGEVDISRKVELTL